jgi:hypothetical protein
MSTSPVPLEDISFRRSITPTAAPPANQLNVGSIAINLKDKIIYSKDDEGSVITVGKCYDDILHAHFTASNPHNITPADLGLSNVPDVDLRTVYFANPLSLTLDHGGPTTEIDRWGPEAVVYSIVNASFQPGDVIVVSRCSNAAGDITIGTDAGNKYMVRGELVTEALIMSGGTPFMTILRKMDADTWLVKVVRI